MAKLKGEIVHTTIRDLEQTFERIRTSVGVLEQVSVDLDKYLQELRARDVQKPEGRKPSNKSPSR